jgi:(p)ppGpp synthase/HD superfamily hydrolase
MAEPELVLKARRFAEEAHSGQMYGHHSYTRHLDDVVAVLRKFGHNDPELLAAGYLHDVMEDVDVGPEELARVFGPRVAALVDAVTDGAEGNREARKARPYRLAPTVPGAVLVKLADRTANIEAALADPAGRLIRMYRKEHAGFEKALRGSPEAEPMFVSLENTLKQT